MSRTITVSTVAPIAVPAGMVPVIARTRGTKGQQIPANQKLRAILVADYDCSGLPSKFTEFVRAQLAVTAVAQLQEMWKTQGDALLTTDAALWTTDALLGFAAREQENKRLTGDSITSACAAFVASLNPAGQKMASEILASMAAPAKKGSEKQLFALAAKLAAHIEELDADETAAEPNPLLAIVARKMHDRAEELKAQRLAFETDNADAF
jgi:hypothetical protein